jgi:hypothetical protein
MKHFSNQSKYFDTKQPSSSSNQQFIVGRKREKMKNLFFSLQMLFIAIIIISQGEGKKHISYHISEITNNF